MGRAQAEGLQLTGEGGQLQQLTKRLLESALEGEITDHLGYDKHDPAGKNGGNSRNGTRAKTVLTDVGPVEITVPRDRDGSFEPKIVKKRQKRLTGVDEMVISLAASRSSTDFVGVVSDGSTGSAPVTLLLVIDASSMLGSYTERFTAPFVTVCRRSE